MQRVVLLSSTVVRRRFDVQRVVLLSSTVVRRCFDVQPASLSTMSTQLQRIRDAYLALTRRVEVALRTQVGDSTRLREVRAQALALAASGDRVRTPPSHLLLLHHSPSSIAQRSYSPRRVCAPAV